jgi:SEC-C motif/Antitoxin Xre/MbcA/ParS C-terminal toxin-binding domain
MAVGLQAGRTWSPFGVTPDPSLPLAPALPASSPLAGEKKRLDFSLPRPGDEVAGADSRIQIHEEPMMAGISRNAPCPCGSGKKYKRCCSRKDADAERTQRLKGQAAGIALDWLDNRYGEQMDNLVRHGFLGNLDDEALSHMSESLLEMAIVNAREYALCEGKIPVGDTEAPALDLVLGPMGPLMDAVQRQHLKDLGEAPLSLYEVVSVQKGFGLGVRDLFDESLPTQQVVDKEASMAFDEGDVLGLRLVPGEPWEISGAVYEFPTDIVPDIQAGFRKALEDSPEGFDRRQLQGDVIVDTWLACLIIPVPTLIGPDGTPILLTTDHYRVKDKAALAAALAAQPDVDGDEQHGWARLENPEAEFPRPILSINPGKTEDRVEVFARTRKMADEGEAWFQEVAGASVELIGREITDPTSPEALAAAADSKLEPFDMSQLPENFWQSYAENNLYKDWADVPIPSLDGKTPRDAIATEEGRRRVSDLLESYRRGETAQARDQGREAIDYTFLWKQVGLEPPEGH